RERRGAGGSGRGVTDAAGGEGPGPVREARALTTSGAGQPRAKVRTRSTVPLKRSWSPTVGPVEVYCHIVYVPQPAGSSPTVEAYRAIHSGVLAAKPA